VSVGLVDCYPALLKAVCWVQCSEGLLLVLLELEWFKFGECEAGRVLPSAVEGDLRGAVFSGPAALSVGTGVAQTLRV
jgi:hypothetical protein